MWTTIGAVSEKIHYGYTEKASNEPIGPKFLRITDIQNNNVNWDSVPYCKIKEEEKKKYLLSEGDLVFARTGATVGKSFIIKEKIPEAVFASYLIRIILDDSLDKIYISYFFHSHFYWLQIHEGEIGIGQPNVNSEKLSKIVFPFPSLAEQQIFVQRLETFFHFADEVKQRVAAATTPVNHLPQSILARAFLGELVPQDPNDEPASVLLERIKHERAELKAKKKTQKRKSKTLLDFN